MRRAHSARVFPGDTTRLLPGFLFMALLSFPFVPARVLAQGALEVPRQNSFVNGIGNVVGWKCTAGVITVSFDGRPQIPVSYGSGREDTRPVCGDTDNGFTLLWNWNLLSDGRHTVRVFDDGVPFAEATFTVVTPGVEFFTKGRATVTVRNFPRTGETTTLRWQESTQSFVMVGRGSVDVENIAGTYQYSGALTTNTCSFSPTEPQLQDTFRLTQQGVTLTAITGLQGGLQLTGQIDPDETFILSSDPQETLLNDGCTQKLTVVVEGDFPANSIDTVFHYEINGACAASECQAIFLGSWSKEH
ncbi:MAG TPA: hypothetical protein VGX03_07125 [Candidatus Binatia bacterium]|nr:hypothetical protein [Candidatus Binatia bacterium]